MSNSKKIISKFEETSLKLNKHFKKFKKKNVDKKYKAKLKELDSKLTKSLKSVLNYLKDESIDEDLRDTFAEDFSLIKEKIDDKSNAIIFSDKQIKLLNKIVKEITNLENGGESQCVNDFWDELAIQQMASGRPPSVQTKNMRKALNGNTKAADRIKKNINVRAAAMTGAIYRACEIRSACGC